MKYKIRLAIGMICFGVLFYACEKQNTDVSKSIISTDKRGKYTGTYQVQRVIYCYGPLNCYSKIDTVIKVSYGRTVSTLLVLGRDVYLDSAGYYSSYHYYLRLWDDSIASSFMNGGLGGGQYENYLGHRISIIPKHEYLLPSSAVPDNF